MTAEPAAVVEKLYAARANGDLDEFRGLLSSDVVWREHPGKAGYAGVHHGVDAVVGDMLGSAMEVTDGTFRVELERTVPHGPLVVAFVRWSATRGGRTMEGREVAVYRISDGLVVEAAFHLDDPEGTDAFFAHEQP